VNFGFRISNFEFPPDLPQDHVVFVLAEPNPKSQIRIPKSNRIRDIDEFHVEIVVAGDPVAEGADAEPFCRVMTGGHVMNTVLGGLMHDPFGGLSGHVGIESGGHSLMKLSRGAASHDSDRRHQPIPAGKDLWLAITCRRDCCEEIIRIDGIWEDSADASRDTTVHPETFELFEPEATS
jgi:hypothetical protein